jgi:hypothetical protein
MKIFNKIKSFLATLFLCLFCVVILSLSLRGLPGNPTSSELNSGFWKENGPFELSPERGRFALLYSIIQDNSFQFSNQIGQFAVPDVAISKGKYVSLFAPLLSFLAIPGYIIGRYFGASQVGTFATISLFALFNFLLIRAISIRLGANRIAATIGAAVFLFATPAFAYAVNLYQHHISTFLILLSIWALLKSNKAWSVMLALFLCALAIPLDYPNLFFLFPVGIFALGRIFSINLDKLKNKISIRVNPLKMLLLLVMAIPILFFLWFNQVSFGNPFQLSGTLQSVRSLNNPKNLAELSASQLKEKEQKAVKKSAIGFFQTRNLVGGFYEHFVSPDRGILYFTPVILLGILGAFLAQRKKVQMTAVLLAIIGANILLYSMWGDPWGGWAFGSRYLIPSYAILAIFIALLLTYWRKNTLFLVIFSVLFAYSAAVNTLGAITTSAMPPQQEVLNLEKISGTIQRYTYQRNWEFLIAGNSKSFVFQTFAKKYMTSEIYFDILAGIIILAGISLTTLLWLRKGIESE